MTLNKKLQSVDHLSGEFVEPLRDASEVVALGARVIQDCSIPKWPDEPQAPLWVPEE